MKNNRLLRSLAALSTVAMLTLPTVAHATSFVTFNPAVSREAYYAAKERQSDQMDRAHVRSRSAKRGPALYRSNSAYVEFKNAQMQRIMDGE